MNRGRFQAIGSLSFALILILMLGAPWQARAQDRQTSYPSHGSDRAVPYDGSQC